MNYLVRSLLALELVYFIVATPTTITAPPVLENFVTPERDDLRDLFGHCLHKKNVSKCLKHRVINVIDDVIKSDEPMNVNLFNINMSLNKNPNFKNEVDNVVDSSRSFEDVISQKLKSLLESRVVQVKLAEEQSETPLDINEARKKKGGGGGKHGMMMSGMALMAFLAQLFLSKVAMMSGAALILAKIALLFSALTSLKKSSGSGGGEHVVYAAEVSKGQGWQRSIHSASAPHQQENSDDLAYRGHSNLPSYDGVPGTINSLHRTGGEYSDGFL